MPPQWKKERQKFQDHKFSFVDIHQFEKKNFWSRMKYSSVFLLVLKSVLVYIADLYNAGTLILRDKVEVGIKPAIPFNISKWLFLASIGISFILLYIEVRKAKKIIASDDISFSFTSTVSYRYYALTSYPHWCFYQEILNRQKMRDKIAFFVFFAFKGWKRLLFCDGPRQIINAMTLYAVLRQHRFTTNMRAYGGLVLQASMGVMFFTVTVFFISACLLLIAFLMYLPLLMCEIRGNLKEYCCLIIDKRISQILKDQAKKNKKNGVQPKKVLASGLPRPTLPNIDDGPKGPYPQYDAPPMFNKYGMSSPPPMVPQGVYDQYDRRKGSVDYMDSSQGVVPIYNTQGQVIGSDQYPPRPDSDNSNSVYSDTTTQYSGNGRPPYVYPPKPQYHYQHMPPNADPYGGGSNYPNVPRHDQYYDDSVPISPQNARFDNNYSPPPQYPQVGNARQQSTNAIPPPHRNNINYQQNSRPW